jgi:RecA-family ATPase
VIEEEVQNGARFVVIDHLHYFSPSETDHAYLGEVMRQINNLCAVHGISVLVVAHTKKGLVVTDKEGKVRSLKPSIDYISGSGMISRHSKNVISLYRNVAGENAEERKTTIVRVDKTKYGPVGQFDLEFHEQNLCFTQNPEYNRAEREAKEMFDNLGKEQPKGESLSSHTPPVDVTVEPEPYLDRVVPSIPDKEEADFMYGDGEEEVVDDQEAVDTDDEITAMVDDLVEQGKW